MRNLPDDIALRRLHFDPEAAEVWEALLPHPERERLAQFSHEKRRREFLMGRAAARTLLAERLGLAPPDVPLCVAADGAVEVAADRLCLSIAHTSGQAVAAVAERPVGIDLERIAPRHPKLHRFLLHPDEHHLFDLPLPREHLLILAWTLKEATLKALRTGLRRSPKKLRLEIDLAHQAAVVREVEGKAWTARFEEQDGCYLAIAFADEPLPSVA